MINWFGCRFIEHIADLHRTNETIIIIIFISLSPLHLSIFALFVSFVGASSALASASISITKQQGEQQDDSTGMLVKLLKVFDPR